MTVDGAGHQRCQAKDLRPAPGARHRRGPYDSVSGSWAIESQGGGVLDIGGHHSSPEGTIDPDAQREFARRWIPWEDFVRVERMK